MTANNFNVFLFVFFSSNPLWDHLDWMSCENEDELTKRIWSIRLQKLLRTSLNVSVSLCSFVGQRVTSGQLRQLYSYLFPVLEKKGLHSVPQLKYSNFPNPQICFKLQLKMKSAHRLFDLLPIRHYQCFFKAWTLNTYFIFLLWK